MTEQARRPVMLVILDGWGWREENKDNAVRLAHTPTFDRLWGNGPHAFLTTGGEDVGLPEGQFGNSEVGHLNIGAGRVVMQDLPRITRAARNGSLATLPPLLALVGAAKAATGRVHLHGSDFAGRGAFASGSCGSAGEDPDRSRPHRSYPRLHRWPRHAAALGLKDSWRSSRRRCPLAPISPRSAAGTTRWIATTAGNASTRAYNAIVSAEAPRLPSADAAIAAAYAADQGDEFIAPAVVGDYAGVRDGDALLCFNFRADRTRQLMNALLDPGFTGFERTGGRFSRRLPGLPSTAPPSTSS